MIGSVGVAANQHVNKVENGKFSLLSLHFC